MSYPEFSSTDYLDMTLLRFTTAGSVDDGKSTLIGRLLYDSKSIFEDQIQAIEESSKTRGKDYVDLSLLTDGLKAEREQGITIDVAYRYFATPKRKFIIADTPGHIQYTRNMVTGASTADVAIILVDARNGIVEQTRRHTYIATLLRLRHIVLAVNKMDLVDFSQERYEEIRSTYREMAEKMGIASVYAIPMSALNGDNVVDRSEKTPWYEGAPLLETLENIDLSQGADFAHGRFPVQYVIRPQSDAFHDYRGYAGRIEGGILRKGDAVTILPSGLSTTIHSVELNHEPLEEAANPLSVTLTLAEDIDISRGDMIVTGELPRQTQDIECDLCWMNVKPLEIGKRYVVRHTTKTVECVVKAIEYRMDISELEPVEGATELKMNEIGRVHLKTTQALFVDSYKDNRATGALILVDKFTNETIGAGMIR
jgi:sulfate adenylyltransferase subunit 1